MFVVCPRASSPGCHIRGLQPRVIGLEAGGTNSCVCVTSKDFSPARFGVEAGGGNSSLRVTSKDCSPARFGPEKRRDEAR